MFSIFYYINIYKLNFTKGPHGPQGPMGPIYIMPIHMPIVLTARGGAAEGRRPLLVYSIGMCIGIYIGMYIGICSGVYIGICISVYIGV